MNIFKRFFQKQSGKNAENIPEDTMSISRAIETNVNDLVNKIFVSYRKELLTEHITYIIPAIWGAKKDGDIDNVQKEIHKYVTPEIHKIYASLKLTNLDDSQAFAIGYIIRGLIISRIVFMIEVSKKNNFKNAPADDEDLHELERMEPLGNA